MGALGYRVHEDESGWQWEVLTPDGRTVASGKRKSDAEARADAPRTSLHLQSKYDDRGEPKSPTAT
jgi:hypothetical protein